MTTNTTPDITPDITPTPYNLIIEEIPLYNVITCPENYNSGNHGARPDDYYQILEKGNTNKWINSFHKDYITINIYDKDIKWMQEAYKSGSYTGKFPNSFEDEKADILERYKYLDKYFDDTKYFVRCNSVSLKYGQHGVGPYITFEQIIESLVTCIETHTPIDNKNRCIEPLTIYLLKWQKFDKYKEYRIFICNNSITAISQQNIYEVNEFLDAFTEEERIQIIEMHTQIIYDSFETNIKKKIIHTSNYCIDAVILENDSLYFIEINSFGKEYAAGSALFHWLNDEDILQGLKQNVSHCNDKNDKNDKKTIYFRYTL